MDPRRCRGTSLEVLPVPIRVRDPPLASWLLLAKPVAASCESVLARSILTLIFLSLEITSVSQNNWPYNGRMGDERPGSMSSSVNPAWGAVWDAMRTSWFCLGESCSDFFEGRGFTEGSWHGY